MQHSSLIEPNTTWAILTLGRMTSWLEWRMQCCRDRSFRGTSRWPVSQPGDVIPHRKVTPQDHMSLREGTPAPCGPRCQPPPPLHGVIAGCVVLRPYVALHPDPVIIIGTAYYICTPMPRRHTDATSTTGVTFDPRKRSPLSDHRVPSAPYPIWTT